MVTKQVYLEQATRRFGRSNPERMDLEHWVEMVRSGESAWQAARRYLGDEPPWPQEPRWCFDRFGMTRTRLPDGRIVCVGGEHEDHYDPDFCIYNDVVVIAPGGEVQIYGYPEDLFPPTDFHTATRLDERLVVVGGLGYRGRRGDGRTPVYTLDLRTFAIAPLATHGDTPGWIHGAHAQPDPDGRALRVSGGQILRRGADGTEQTAGNDRVFRLDPRAGRWTVRDGHWLDPPPPDEAVPEGWLPIRSQHESRYLTDGLSRSVAPDHPLFADDHVAVAQTGDPAETLLLRSRDDPRRYVVSEGPTWTGRADEPLRFERYDTLDEWVRATEGRDENWWR